MLSLGKMSAAPAPHGAFEERVRAREVYVLVLWRPRGGSAVMPGAWAAGLTVLAGSVKFSEKLCKREGNTKALRNGQPGSRPLHLSLTLRF